MAAPGGGHAWLLPGGGVRGCSQGGGACVVALGGVHGFISGGHAWFYSGGHVWFYLGGMRGFIWGGACMVFSVFFGYNEIRSMSGRYASYWNAFLYYILLSVLSRSS